MTSRSQDPASCSPRSRSPPGPRASQSWGAGPCRPASRPASRDRPGRARATGRASPPRRVPTPHPASPRRLPVPPGGQQGLAQVRAQLPQSRLGFWHLQRPGPLLKPDPQLHGGRERDSAARTPGAPTVTTERLGSSRLQRPLP